MTIWLLFGNSWRSIATGFVRWSKFRLLTFAASSTLFLSVQALAGCAGHQDPSDGGSRDAGMAVDSAGLVMDAAALDAAAGVCGSSATCDDGVACTNDGCDRVTMTCRNDAQDSNCPSGMTCDATRGCVVPDCTAGGVCDASTLRPDAGGPDAGPLDATVTPRDAYVPTDAADRDGCTSTPWYRDDDRDGYGDPTMELTACEAPMGYVDNADDCNDACDSCWTGAPDLCDGLNNDCSGDTSDGQGDPLLDSACDGPDADLCEGGMLRCEFGMLTCYEPGYHYVEVCNGTDDDCDGNVDEGLSLYTFYYDGDGDTYGDATMPVEACRPPAGYRNRAGDCNDSDGDIHPDATEVCNTLDDDCDATVDEDPSTGPICPPTGTTTNACESGVCAHSGCMSGYADCDGDELCDTRLNTWDNCGACGDRCGYACRSGICEEFLSVEGGLHHTCASTSLGGVLCWGDNTYGQIGNGSSDGFTDVLTPYRLSTIWNAVEVSVGYQHSCALRTDGSVACWGNGGSGRLGNGYTSNRTSPSAVTGLTSAAIAISAGTYHTCAVLEDGHVACWGENSYGQLGNGTTANRSTPVVVIGITSAVAVAAGGYHTCALLDDGTAQCWGRNGSGQLGRGSTSTSELLPGPVSGLSAIDEVDAGDFFTCGRAGGRVYCWGSNSDGQLGGGGITGGYQSAPGFSILTGAVDLSLGALHACATTSDTVYCWGQGWFGKLGNGSTSGRSAPSPVSAAWGATFLGLGANHSCARRNSNGLYCWGYNSDGQLGDGTRTSWWVPERILGR